MAAARRSKRRFDLEAIWSRRPVSGTSSILEGLPQATYVGSYINIPSNYSLPHMDLDGWRRGCPLDTKLGKAFPSEAQQTYTMSANVERSNPPVLKFGPSLELPIAFNSGVSPSRIVTDG